MRSIAIAALAIALVSIGLNVALVASPESFGLVSEDQAREDARALARASSILREQVAVLEDEVAADSEVIALTCDGLEYLTSLSVADGRTDPDGLPLELQDTCPR